MTDDDFRIGEWLVQPSRNRIEGPNGASTVKLKSMAVLGELAKARGAVVAKQALLDRVWGSAVVTEDVLTQSIVELRKAFADSAGDPQVIETIRRVGFRLIPEVRPPVTPGTDAGGPGARALAWGVLVAAIAAALAIGLYRFNDPAGVTDGTELAEPSIAVLPFDNLSDDSEQQYFADGLAEELLDRLTKVPGLRVPARTSSFAFRGRAMDVRTIGRQLGVGHVLEGSIRKSEQRIRITAQLIETRSGNHKWSKVFERELGDVFAVQDEIAAAIVNALGPNFDIAANGFATGTPDVGAYDLYLLGRHHLGQERITRALEFFDKAIAQDPAFARAYAGLAEASLGFRDTPSSFWQAKPDADGLERAQWAIDNALELDPRLAEAYAAQAALHVARGETDLEEKALRKALEAKPDYLNALGRLAATLAAQRRYREAIQAYQRAGEVDPLNPTINAGLARLIAQTEGYDAALEYPYRLLESDLATPQIFQVLMSISADFGRYDERVKWGLRLAELAPNRAAALAELADAYMELGEFELARVWADRAAQISPAEAFKAETRLLYASEDFDGFERLTAEAFRRNRPLPGQPLTLTQATTLPLYAISRFSVGDYQEAAALFERILEESPAIARRPPHLAMYARALLANTYQRLGAEQKARAAVTATLEVAEHANAQGITAYPPLTRELAKAYALLGDKDRALQYHTAAVSQGWRQYFLESRAVTDPVQQLLGDDPRYRASVEEMKSDLERMRRVVRRNGWDVTPDALL